MSLKSTGVAHLYEWTTQTPREAKFKVKYQIKLTAIVSSTMLQLVLVSLLT